MIDFNLYSYDLDTCLDSFSHSEHYTHLQIELYERIEARICQ